MLTAKPKVTSTFNGEVVSEPLTLLSVLGYRYNTDRLAPYQQRLWSHTKKARFWHPSALYGRAVTLNANDLTGENMTNTLISVQQYLTFAIQNSWFILKCHHCFHIIFWRPLKKFVRVCTFIAMEFENFFFFPLGPTKKLRLRDSEPCLP